MRYKLLLGEKQVANVKILEDNEILQMKEVLEDDNMVFDVKNLEKFLKTSNSYGFIAKVDDKIVGFAYGYGLQRPDGRVMLYLHSIGILPNYQDKGIGSKLMNFIIDFARGKNFSELFVITDKGNPRACHLYEKFGGKNDYEDEIVYVYDFLKK